VAEHELDGDVFFAGPTVDPVPFLQASDVLVQPSHYEAFPVTVIEAMACGLPVVASWVGGLCDYLIDGENALVCPPGDVAALADRLDTILTDADLRTRLAQAGRAVVSDRFSRNRNLDAYAAVFDGAAPPRGRGRSS
jgi:glycosyltransferase involved in cell wall biosynthesis